MSRHLVLVYVTTSHYVPVDVPDALHTVAPSVAADTVRRMPPEEIRRIQAVGTTTLVDSSTVTTDETVA